MNASAFCTCVISALIAVTFAVIPPYIKVCNRNDPEINKCIANSIEHLREKLATGIPELDVPAIEPFRLDNLRLLRGPSSASLDLNLTDIQVRGPSMFEVHNLKTDVNKLVFTYDLTFKKLEFKGKYSVNARILLLQLDGVGNLTGYFDNYSGNVIMKAKKVRRDNNIYLHFDKMKFNIKISKAFFELDNLFNGDKVLGDATNQLLNENNDVILQEIVPLLKNSLEKLFTDIANKITQTFTYEELFPNN
ncbi:protein takeout-like isoform X2 [Harpegnathos saltator]|uniref:protein takeout-like isoform X2 n=1 Tax=Harpegnathos saltator TaxID=610380 RepID=UPI0005917DF1|nr:protein takeout-like isoform X2 [Harpegnathos saltator]